MENGKEEKMENKILEEKNKKEHENKRKQKK